VLKVKGKAHRSEAKFSFLTNQRKSFLPIPVPGIPKTGSQLATVNVSTMREVVPKTVETYLTRNGKDVFQKWLNGLADLRAKALIDKTVAKVRLGNLGQLKSVGEGVQEIVLDYGPGYRIYFGEHGATRVILLCGSTKKRQEEAIKEARQ
jgi:putative addiction module killer protein